MFYKLLQLDLDDWEINGKIYRLLSYEPRENSTAVRLRVENMGVISNMVVASHQIIWVN